MYHSFVTTDPLGPENSADIDISLQSPGKCLALREHFFDETLLKSWHANVKLPWLSGHENQKPHVRDVRGSTALWG